MIRALYTAVSGMKSQQAKQQVVINNLSNMDTNGYKEDNLIVKKFSDVLIENKDNLINGKSKKNIIGSLSLGTAIDEVYTKFLQGNITTTDSETDFAIDGNGFFTVEREQDGTTSRFYSRDGNFSIDNQGYLITSSGDYVLGNDNSNNVSKIYVGNNDLISDEYGNLSIGNDTTLKLFINDFNDYADLDKVGDNLYSGDNPNSNNNYSIKQNSLEGSNVDLVNNLIEMTTITRAYEANQKIIEQLNETLGYAVNDLGKVR